MTRTEEIEMNTNENIHANLHEDVIELGVASIETQGGGKVLTEILGEDPTGISED